MKKKDVEIGKTYTAKVSGKLTTVRLDRENPYGGWDATNLETCRRVRIKTAAKLRRKVGGVSPSTAKLNEALGNVAANFLRQHGAL